MDPNTDTSGMRTKINQITSLPLVFFYCVERQKKIDTFYQNHKDLIWLLVKHGL